MPSAFFSQPAPPYHLGVPIRSVNNLQALDYAALAPNFRRIAGGIIDAHAHITGPAAAAIYGRIAAAFGVVRTYTMTQFPHCDAVRDVLGDRLRFIAFPTWNDPDKSHAHSKGYCDVIEQFHTRYNSTILKLWCSPRLREIIPETPDAWDVDSPWKRRAAEVGFKLGMKILVHIADPDTWFATKWADSKKFGTKREKYIGLERMIDDFPTTWIIAHCGGWPEDLDFLEGMLSRHQNLYYDLSATKWMVRELSRHPRERTLAFFTRFQDRLLFGSDIVTSDDHLSPSKTNPASPKADQADSPESAFDLYASRYFALRAMFDTLGDQPSPIADPDLKMVDPATFNDLSSPTLRGLGLPDTIAQAFYHGNARRILETT
jgi:hypothetical protein